jgi:hypothetical protein
MAQRLPFAASLASGVLALLFGAGPFAPHVHAQPAPKPKDRPKEVPLIDRLRSPYEADRPVADKLRSPRETLRTFYYAVILYDVFPEMIDDAVACLDVDGVRPRPGRDDAAKMALALENVLDGLALPLGAVPDEPAGESVVLYEAGAAVIAMRRRQDALPVARAAARRGRAAQATRRPARHARGVHRRPRHHAAVPL